MEVCIVPKASRQVSIILEYEQMSDLLALLQRDSESESYKNDQPDKIGTLLCRVEKCVAILLNTEASVPVTAKRARLVNMATYPNQMANRVILPTLGIVNAPPHTPVPIMVWNFVRKLTTMPKVMLFGVGIHLLDIIVHLIQAVIIPQKGRERGG